MMIVFIVLHLLTLLPNSFVSVASINEALNPFIVVPIRQFKYLSAASCSSPTPQGSISGPPGRTFPRHEHQHQHGHGTANNASSPSATPGCGRICEAPHTSAPLRLPCTCVLPIHVKLLLGVPVQAVFPRYNELRTEVAVGTYLKESQVTIAGATADIQYPDKTVVDFTLVPLGEEFDNATASLIYQRVLQKQVHLSSCFGDYDVLNISYPGFPALSGSHRGGGPRPPISGNPQYPYIGNLFDRHGKLDPQIIFIITLSAFVLLVLCFAAVAVILNYRKVCVPPDAVSLVSTPPISKITGIRNVRSSTSTSSTSTSLVSAMHSSILSVKTFSLVELKKATDNFSPKKVLGEGGFGRVYHGILENGIEVAVKLLTRDNQNKDCQFNVEIEMLSQLHHRNLVKLIGICIEERTRCLVYELVSNGSVDSHLHGANAIGADRIKGPLDWDTRLKIALGAARGLAYLHEDSNPRVIHRDFKASNILLEDDFTPKVSDFGLAREATEGSHHISTRVMGTFGYIAPEYAMTGHLLVKSDVYSYGVVLLELLSGRKPVDMSRSPGEENLVTWARPLLTDRQGLEQLADPALAGTYNLDDMAKIAAIASMCVHPEVTRRPFMGEVVQALKLIYHDNNKDDTCGNDVHTPLGSSACYLDIKGDFVISNSRWWSGGGITPSLTYGQGSSFFQLEHGLGFREELENVTSSSSGLPAREENRSASLRVTTTNPIFYGLRGSMSEHKNIGASW